MRTHTQKNSWDVVKNGLSNNLYTWIDVQERIRAFQQSDDGLPWFIGKSIRAYWDGIYISYIESNENEIDSKLETIFLARYVKDKKIIVLGESPNTIEFPVIFQKEDEAEDIIEEPFLATFSPPRFIANVRQSDDPRLINDIDPTVLAFHSFKGGVGRTLHAMALAVELKKKGKKVLLIDADFEAPGISWYFPNLSISFTDFIGMIHGDRSDGFSYSLNNTASQISQNNLDESILLLPAFRDVNRFGTPIITPEHLNTIQTPFLLQDLTIELGKILKADYIIIDLRAGLSELSSGWLLDPKIYKIIVTTLSSQSLQGTDYLIQKVQGISDKFGMTKYINVPFIIFSQVPNEKGILKMLEESWNEEDEASYNIDFDNLKKQYLLFFNQQLNDVDQFPSWIENVCFSIEYDSLKTLPNQWEDIVQRIKDSPIIERIDPLLKWLPFHSQDSVPTTDPNGDDSPADRNLDMRRQSLSEIAGKLITADSNIVEDFLVTQSIEKLAERHLRQLPIVIIVGAKGSGKTYLFKSLSKFNDWASFVNKVRGQIDSTIVKANYCRVTTPENVSAGEHNPNRAIIKAYIEQQLLDSSITASQWRIKWLNIIAWAAGVNVGKENAWAAFYLSNTDQKIFLFDGLEELFYDYFQTLSHQIALRALLQDVPNWLESLTLRKIGLIIFIRQDIVSYVIPQNITQFLSRYQDFQLKWNEEEALRLAFWVSQKAAALNDERNPKDLDKAELEITLYPVWGQRLGGNNSREARTSNWVLGALSNLQDEVQSRDIVRFLHFAAEASKIETTKRFYPDRLLMPTSIKSSIARVGIEKIEEVKQENKRLYDILQKIKERADLRFPCAKSSLDEFLDTAEKEMLERNGVMREYKNEYYLAEIYRRGLGISYSKVGKPKVF